jgi:DNA-binding MarR family transcriptional regulator
MKPIGPSKHLGYLLKDVQHKIRTRMDEALREIDLTTPQYAIMSELDEYPGLSNADLARKSFVTPQTMNLIVRNLEDRGLVVKQADRNHRRKQRIQLTLNGKRKLKRAHSVVNEIETDLFRCLSAQERSAFEAILLKISDQSGTPIRRSENSARRGGGITGR